MREYTLESNYINAVYVAGVLLEVIGKHMRKYTLGKNHINALHVARVLPEVVI